MESYIARNSGVFEALSSRWPQAQKMLEKSIHIMPANAASRYLMGMYFLETQEWRKAVNAFEASLLLDPDFKAPYINEGVAWLHLREWACAIEVCEAGLYRHPQTAHCFSKLLLGNLGFHSW